VSSKRECCCMLSDAAANGWGVFAGRLYGNLQAAGGLHVVHNKTACCCGKLLLHPAAMASLYVADR
jgi:hypothetical protein